MVQLRALAILCTVEILGSARPVSMREITSRGMDVSLLRSCCVIRARFRATDTLFCVTFVTSNAITWSHYIIYCDRVNTFFVTNWSFYFCD